MLSNELLHEVRALDDDDKFTLLQILIDDLSLSDHGYEIFGFRGNAQIAGRMLEILERRKTASSPEVK
ncbi:MAG: hypothetical protein OXG68_09925 [Chloroflexi bacterium]|nr:hypothetical protein [Chloroflexota bacterium]